MEPNWLSGPLPFHLGMALVENPPALQKYAALGRAEKQLLIENAANLTTRSELQTYVQNFASK